MRKVAAVLFPEKWEPIAASSICMKFSVKVVGIVLMYSNVFAIRL